MACDNGCCNTTPRIVQLPAASSLDGGPYTVDLNTPDDGIFRVTDTTSGETFEVDVHQLQCDFFSERLVLDASASTAGADFGSGTAVAALSGGADPGEAAHQAYIDANIDYTAPAGNSTSLNPPDTTAIGQTDSGWVAFHVVVPAGATRTLTWEWAGEGYGRLEVAECGIGDYEIVDATWTGAGAGTAQVTVTLDAGVHLIRMTQVDSGGNANAWAYVGDPIEFYAASAAAPSVAMQLVAVDCDGNVVDVNGDPVTGTLIPVADWTCPTGVTVAAENIVGELFNVTAGTTAAAGDDSLGSAAIEVGETLHFYQGAPGEDLLVSEGSGIVRLPVPNAGWVNGASLPSTGTLVAEDETSYVYVQIPDGTLDLDLTGMTNGREFEIRMHPQDNIGDLTLNAPAGGTISSDIFGGTNGANASITITGGASGTADQAQVIRLRKISDTVAWVTNVYPEPTAAAHPAGQVAACFGPAQISNGGVPPNADLQSEFTPHHDGDYTFVHEGSDFNTGTANGGFTVGTALGGSDVYASGGAVPPRIDAADPRREVTLALTGGVTYFLAQWAGGGSSYETSLCVAEAGLSTYVAELVDAATDLASTEVGNLIVEGDDGEEYALPLKAEDCYDETLAPSLLANFDATDPNDDFSIDDQFFTVSNNTGADQELGAVQFVTDGAWPATDRTISFAGGALSGSVVVPGGTASGTTITVPLDAPVTVVDGGTQSIQLTTSDFSGAQGTGVANAMVFGGIVRHIVRTYSDGETDKVIDFDVNGEPQEITAIPAEWVACPTFDQDAIDAIKQQIIDCQVISTECYVEVEGVRQYDAEGEDTGGPTLPHTLLFPSTASGAGTAGDIIVHFNDVGATLLVEIALTIIADGVPVEHRTDERIMGGASEFFRFGYFEFQAGVEYELEFETVASDINLYGTIDPVSDDGITFAAGTNAAFGIPQIRIVSPGESQFSVVTDAQGVVTAYDAGRNVVPATVNLWMPCPLDATERAEVERLIAENECPPIGVTEVAPTLETTSRTIGLPGTIVAPGVAVTASQGATGQTLETPIQFHGRLPGEVVDAVMRVTRLGAGGGAIVIQAGGGIINTSGGTDHLIEVELADGLEFRWELHPASAGGSESFQFTNNPVVEYAPGAGGIALTLPFNGTWANGNNGAQSGMSFAAANTLTFRSNGVAGASSSFFIALRDVPTFPRQTACERSVGLLTLVEDNASECDVVGAAEELDGQSGTLADGTTWFRTLTDTISASTLTDGIGGDVRWDNSGLITYTFSKPVNFLAGPTSDPALADPIVWTYVNAPPPNTNNGPWTRLISDGDPVEYVAGAVDVTPFLNTFGPSQADAGQANTGAASTAQDDWGLFTAPASMVVTIEGRDAEAMNFSAQPLTTEQICDALASVRSDVSALTPAAAQFRVSAGTGPVDILESDLSAGKSAVLIAHASEQTQINIPTSIFTAANIGQSVTVLINSTLGGQSPEITSEDVEGDGGNGVFAFEDSFELFSAGVGFGYVIPHRG